MIRKDLLSLIAQRSWLSIAGFGTILILPGTVSPGEQGLFFSFLSIAALQTVFDAGITSIFVNFCAHEKAQYNGSVTERLKAQSRLTMIALAARRWFLIVMAAFIFVVGIGGFYFIKTSLPDAADFHGWQFAYALLIAAIGTSLFNLSRVAVLEGWGHMGDIARIRLRASIASTAVLWLGLFADLGVLALSLSYSVQTAILLWGTQKLSKNLPLQEQGVVEIPSTGSKVSWKKDIYPLQLRLGISYFCGYLVSHAVVPFALKAYGPIEAGRIGLASAIFSAATTVLASLIYLSGPKYAEHIVRKNWTLLKNMFQKTTAISLVFGILSYASLTVFLIGLTKYVDFFSGRLPDLSVLLALGLIGVANLYVGSAATLMRAFKQEPMLPISIFAAALYVGAMFIAQRTDPEMLFILMAASQLLFIAPLTMVVKRSFLMRATSS